MIFSQDRQALRQMYADAWRKYRDGEPMTPLESQIANVILLHPEYHDALHEEQLDADFTVAGGKTNPFLHMGLHLGLLEQVSTDRPAGIATVHRQLVAKLGDLHAAEHKMIDCLAETLWESQKLGQPPDEAAYLERLRRL